MRNLSIHVGNHLETPKGVRMKNQTSKIFILKIDIFHCEDILLQKLREKTELTDDRPIFTELYRISAIHVEEVRAQTHKMLDQGIINSTIYFHLETLQFVLCLKKLQSVKKITNWNYWR